MLESLLRNRKTILRDRCITWARPTRAGESSAMLAAGSTSGDRGCSPFWTSRSRARSAALPSATATDFAASPSTSSNTYSGGAGSNSWSTTRRPVHRAASSPTTFSPSSKYFAADATALAGTEAPTTVYRLRRVKLKLTAPQRAQLKDWSDVARFTYNETVSRVESGEKVNGMALRNAVVTEKNNAWVEARPWLRSTPKAVRQQAVFRCCSAYKGAFTRLRNGDIRHFKMKKQKKRANTWTIGIERGARLKAGELHIFPAVMAGPVRYYGKLPPLEHDMSIHKDAAGRIFLGVPVAVPVVKREADERPTVALDPGVRKFLTAFDTVGTAQFIGADVRDRFWSILQHIDEVDRRMPRVAHVERRRLRKKKLLLFKQYQDLRDEFHWKAIDALTKEYSMIILPRLNTPQMIRRSEGTWRG